MKLLKPDVGDSVVVDQCDTFDDLSQHELHITAHPPTDRSWRALWEYKLAELEALEALEVEQVGDPTVEPQRDELAMWVEVQRQRDEQLIADYQRRQGRAS